MRYARGAHGVRTAQARGTHGVRMGFERGTHEVHRRYARGTYGLRNVAYERMHLVSIELRSVK